MSTLLGLVVVSLVAVGIRLRVVQSVQQRRERQYREINERLKTLIAADQTLGGSLTGNLPVDPIHTRQLNALPPIRGRSDASSQGGGKSVQGGGGGAEQAGGGAMMDAGMHRPMGPEDAQTSEYGQCRSCCSELRREHVS